MKGCYGEWEKNARCAYVVTYYGHQTVDSKLEREVYGGRVVWSITAVSTVCSKAKAKARSSEGTRASNIIRMQTTNQAVAGTKRYNTASMWPDRSQLKSATISAKLPSNTTQSISTRPSQDILMIPLSFPYP